MPALDQAEAILSVLDERGTSLTFMEVVRATGLAKSSVHSVLDHLTRLGWVERCDDGKVRVGLRLVELASSRLDSMDVVSRFVEACGRRQILPNEALVLSMLIGDEALYLACRNGNRPVGLQYRIGMRLPAVTTASGKAMLANLTDDAVRRLYPDGYVGPGGIAKTLDQLLDELRLIRHRGYSIDDEETAPGMICFGAALDEPRGGGEPCAVAISLMKASLAAYQHDGFGQEVTALARSLR